MFRKIRKLSTNKIEGNLGILKPVEGKFSFILLLDIFIKLVKAE